MKTLAEITAEVRRINIEKGWRPAEGGPGSNSFGDYIALLHSEVSEALEAFRDHRLEDATLPRCDEVNCPRYDRTVSAGTCALQPDGSAHATVPGKPEGVGSELADVLIRLVDMCDVFSLTPFDMDMELADVSPISLRPGSFGDHIALLHFHAARIVLTWRTVDHLLSTFLRALVTVSEAYGIDLQAEVERKVRYNATRAFQHGGRTLADEK